MRLLVSVFLLLAFLREPAHAVTAVVLDVPGFALHGKGWLPDLLGGMEVNQQAIDLILMPPARAVSRFYEKGEGDLFAANLLCRSQDNHFLTLGLLDYEVFIARRGDKIPGPTSLPPAGARVLVVRGFNHPFIRQNPELRWEEVTNIGMGLDMLRAHRADYFFSFLALNEDAIRTQGSDNLFDYSASKAVGEVWPSLVFRPTDAGLQLAQQFRQQLIKLSRTGQFARVLLGHGTPAWHIRPGLEGRFSVIRAEECSADLLGRSVTGKAGKRP